MSENRVSVKELITYRITMFDDGNIRLFYSHPQDVFIEDTVIRIGSLQIIPLKNIQKIIRDDDRVHICLKDESVIQLQIVF